MGDNLIGVEPRSVADVCKGSKPETILASLGRIHSALMFAALVIGHRKESTIFSIIRHLGGNGLAPRLTSQIGSLIVGRKRRYLDLIEPCHIVSLGPDSELAADKLAIVKRCQHPLVVQPNRESVVFGGNLQGLPMIPRYLGKISRPLLLLYCLAPFPV